MNQKKRTTMKNTMLRSLSLFGISLAMALSVAAQDEPKVKISDNENKYKSEDLKIKEKKEESKYKADDLKMKDEKEERKIKAKVKPMRITTKEKTEIKTGKTDVRVKEHMEPVTTITPQVSEPVVGTQEPVAVPKTTVKKSTARKYSAAKKTSAPKRTAARKAKAAPKYIVRTKVVRDTVYVPSPPETIVSMQKEYVHDTVTVTRVDTVVKMQTENTYTGYSVPRGDFKKVKLERDKDGEVWMKRKMKDGKIKTEKLKQE
jgi:hypothetical protein